MLSEQVQQEQVRQGRSARRRCINGEMERYCRKCGEWWPETAAFFYRCPADKTRFRNPCIACISEKKAATNAVRVCCVPGCNRRRHNGGHRCYEHRYYAMAKGKGVMG